MSVKDQMDRLLRLAYERHSSDLHICSGILPVIRRDGQLETLTEYLTAPLAGEDIRAFIAKTLLSEAQQKDLQETGSADAGYCFWSNDGRAIRCRVNAFRDANGMALAFRLIQNHIPSMQELRIPGPLQDIRRRKHGMVIITGPTGSGKTTTLAALLDAINAESPVHIITIEQPIEYQFQMKRAVISQREVGRDCISFLEGLRSSLRQDPDVILIGEMRDAETITTALAAAETGHLVFTTLHSANVVEAIDRLVQYFPATRHQEIRNELANSFLAIVAQKLLPSRNSGRVAAFEVLLSTDSTKNVIRSSQNFRIQDYMHRDEGMQTMAESIRGLRNKHLIDG